MRMTANASGMARAVGSRLAAATGSITTYATMTSTPAASSARLGRSGTVVGLGGSPAAAQGLVAPPGPLPGPEAPVPGEEPPGAGPPPAGAGGQGHRQGLVPALDHHLDGRGAPAGTAPGIRRHHLAVAHFDAAERRRRPRPHEELLQPFHTARSAALAQTEIEAAVRGTDEPQARLDQLHGSRGKDPVKKRPYARPKRESRHGRHWLAAGADDADVARPERETAIANVPGELRGPDSHRK